MPEVLKFKTDGTLGRLARWLRVIGYDAMHEKAVIDRQFLEKSRKEERIVLTRRRDLSQRNYRGTMIIIKSDSLRDQIRELKSKLPELTVMPERLFTICLQCNRPLSPAERSEVKDLVPPYVFETQEAFMMCQSCGKIFWAGTHRERAEKFLRDLGGK